MLVLAWTLQTDFNTADLLLLHKLGVGTVVDNILAKDWGGEDGVYVLGADIANLAIEDEIIALGADTDRSLAAEEDKGEDITVLK